MYILRIIPFIQILILDSLERWLDFQRNGMFFQKLSLKVLGLFSQTTLRDLIWYGRRIATVLPQDEWHQ